MNTLGQKILIIENSRFYKKMLIDSFSEQLSYPIVTAENLKEAQDILHQHPDIYLVITGLVLPDANGDEILNVLSSYQKMIVVVTGSYNADTRERLMGTQFVDYVVKNSHSHINYLIWLARRLDHNRQLHATVVDDSTPQRKLASGLLRRVGFNVVEFDNGPEALKYLAQKPPMHLLVTDFEMDDMNGIVLTDHVREIYPRHEMAIIGVSGAKKPHLVAEFLKMGANDFLQKPYSPEEFFSRISQNVDQIDLMNTLKDVATKDYLTRLYNRRFFMEEGQKIWNKKKRAPCAVAVFDIDYFKKINDTYGHDGGDEALREISSVVHKIIQEQSPGSILARMGGEEFAFLSYYDSEEQFISLCETIRLQIEKHIIHHPLTQNAFSLTVSMGVFLETKDVPISSPLTLTDAYSKADIALYEAKKAGRNNIKNWRHH